MLLLCFVALYLSFDFVLGEGPKTLIQPGSCSKKCSSTDHTIDPNITVETLPKFPCSCSASCSFYKDCCYDSPFRNLDKSIKKSHTMCLSVSGSGQFKAIAGCPKKWPGSSNFCTDTIGFFPPVTSMATGATYANIYCAVCNEDGEDLRTWTVDLRCCKKHEEFADRRYVKIRGHLYSRISNREKCFCRYQVRNNDTRFLDGLELRTCERSQEISRCSPSWDNTEDERLCKAFLDPVYFGDKIYRNQYCALCNHKALENAQCLPSVVARMLSDGADVDTIVEHCQRHQLSVCLHYIMSSSRGRSYSFSDLMDIRSQSCFPEPGERCCQGERYDYRAKRCRKLVS